MKHRKKEYECMDCAYYLQHYTYSDGRWHEVYCGHCTNKLNGKFRKTNKICDQFKLLSKKEKTKRDKATLERKIDSVITILGGFKEYLEISKK